MSTVPFIRNVVSIMPKEYQASELSLRPISIQNLGLKSLQLLKFHGWAYLDWVRLVQGFAI